MNERIDRADAHTMVRPSPVFQRLLAATLMLLLLGVTVNLFRPQEGKATLNYPDESGRAARADVSDSSPEDAGTVIDDSQLIALGELESRRYVVRVYGGLASPRFSVFKHDGQQVGELVTRDTLEALIVDRAFLDEISAFVDDSMLMQADPDRIYQFQ